MNKIIFSILFPIFINTLSFSQVIVKNINLNGDIKEIKIDSILKIPLTQFDSIIVKNIEIPDFKEKKSNCIGCSGGYYKSYLIADNIIIKSEFTRGSNCNNFSECDDEISHIYDNVLEIAKKYFKLEKEEVYLISIRIDFDWGDEEEIYIDNNSTFRKFIIIRKESR